MIATVTTARRSPAQPQPVARRLAALDWREIGDSLDRRGYATTGALLSGEECAGLVVLYGEADRFRSRVIMQRHGFGRGEYQYFAYPLPPLVEQLRSAAFAHLAPVARHWNALLRHEGEIPATLDDYLARCHAAGQTRPTALMLKYGPDDFNCLHQDLYGPLVFPLQLTILLSRPGVDFTGGEFLLVEQRPRAQSRGEVVPLVHGEAVIFAVNHRPAQGTRGPYRLALRHGVSRLRCGERFSLGVIFHDAA